MTHNDCSVRPVTSPFQSVHPELLVTLISCSGHRLFPQSHGVYRPGGGTNVGVKNCTTSVSIYLSWSFLPITLNRPRHGCDILHFFPLAPAGNLTNTQSPTNLTSITVSIWLELDRLTWTVGTYTSTPAPSPHQSLQETWLLLDQAILVDDMPQCKLSTNTFGQQELFFGIHLYIHRGRHYASLEGNVQIDSAINVEDYMSVVFCPAS